MTSSRRWTSRALHLLVVTSLFVGCSSSSKDAAPAPSSDAGAGPIVDGGGSSPVADAGPDTGPDACTRTCAGTACGSPDGCGGTCSCTVVALAAGSAHTCALTDSGNVKCWGSNEHGQLGNGSKTDSAAGVDVSGLGGAASAIAAGAAHTCALMKSGGVKCWGQNKSGQLGNDSYIDSSVPVDATGLASGVTAIAAGGDSFLDSSGGDTCAIVSGTVKCWGAFVFHEGATIVSGSITPTAVMGLDPGTTQIALGGGHACVVTSDGSVLCWGTNDYGQVGTGTQPGVLVLDPTAPAGLGSGAMSIAAGARMSCALLPGGAVWCWGGIDSTIPGGGQSVNSLVPEPVVALGAGVTKITAGYEHACAVTSVGGAQCWGGNGYGQIGNDSTDEAYLPTPVSGLGTGVKTIAAGDFHVCALTSSAEVKCWGRNDHGQLGNGSTTDSHVPVSAKIP